MKKRHPRTLSSGDQNTVIALSETEVAKIKTVEDLEISSEQRPYKLLIVASDEETLDLLLGMKIGSELLGITVEGEE